MSDEEEEESLESLASLSTPGKCVYRKGSPPKDHYLQDDSPLLKLKQTHRPEMVSNLVSNFI